MKLLFSVVATALLAPAVAHAQASPSYASASVSYLWGAPSGTPLYSITTGATATASIRSDVSYNGVQEAYSQANLAAGTLRARSGGTADEINASAGAQFGDTFGAIDAGTGRPYTWRADDQVTFRFSVTGSVQSTLSAAEMAAKDKGFQSMVWFNFYAFKPGYFERQARLDALFNAPWPWPAENSAEIARLSAEIDALQLTRSFARLGQEYSPYYDASGLPYTAFSADTPTVISATFAPGGSFEWIALLDVSTRFAADTPLGYRPTFAIDFSHTVGARFSGPAGTVTASASGLFPDTVPMAPVPEPSAWALMLLGGAGLLGLARRRTCAQGSRRALGR